ncbi:MAG: STAS domain-containing protein [Myxococcales bacterium]|nr:STAS domain-containing protein [Myxococcales bacterium]MCB9646177.1 STAS domain-containing protein [Deltaproteobacteria bacterium]
MLDYDRQERGDVTIFSLKGNLDALTAPSLKKEIESLLASRKINVVFDLAGLELIDSSGVGAIVSLFKRVRTLQGDVKIARLQGQPAEIFKLLRLDKAFDIFDTIDRAVERFRS